MSKKVSNMVKESTLKEIQLSILEDVSNAVMSTAGPFGSNTMILKGDSFPTYSKDGKKVLDSINYYGCIERSILDELSQLTSYVVKEVGDGTTSAIRLSYLIFRELMAFEKKRADKNFTPNDVITSFQKVTKEIQKEIIKHKRDITLEDIYKICMISTNGNEEVSRNISDIYNKYGFNVYIDLGISNSTDHVLKEYDGVTLDKGYSSNAYINREDLGRCEVRNANIYYFRDPINTPEMLAFFTNIIYNNVIIPASGKDQNRNVLIPTVILAPSISRDAEVLLSDIETMLYNQKPVNRPELLVITKLNRFAQEVDDIAKLCGCPPIMNYIDPTVQKKDQETGKAPTIETITAFCGGAELVEADSSRTKFINPKNMYKTDEQGNIKPTDIYSGLIASVEAELNTAKENNEDAVTITMLKRRLNTLKCDLVQYFIGGISTADRDACKDLAEDAILNCRAAIVNGVGYGMNFEGFRAITVLSNLKTIAQIGGFELPNNYTDLDFTIIDMIYNSYYQLIQELYNTAFVDTDEVNNIICESIQKDMPMNIKTKEFDGSVLSSINTDIVILDAISKIVTIMYTSNQCLIPDSLQNTYESNN